MRSGKLLATNDMFVLELLGNANYDIRPDGTIWTLIAPTGKVYVDKTRWREAGNFKDKEGQRYWSIRSNGKSLRRSRIIYAKFLAGKNGNPELSPDLVINHIDGNSLNDHPSNLELVSQSLNNFHRFRTMKRPAVIGHQKITYEIAEQIRSDKRLGLTHVELKVKYGLKSKGSISDIISYKTWKAEVHLK